MIERVIHTVKTDMVIHTEKTEKRRLVVEIEYFGKIDDVFDKATGSFDGLQPEQVDLNYVHALNEPHLHEIRVVLTGWLASATGFTSDGHAQRAQGESVTGVLF
nr:hypothetical protein [Tanacetum cinerariifolium]